MFMHSSKIMLPSAKTCLCQIQVVLWIQIVFSLVLPYYSAEGTSRHKLEEEVMDNFHDFLSTVEDNNITGYTEALAWKDKNDITDEMAFWKLRRIRLWT